MLVVTSIQVRVVDVVLLRLYSSQKKAQPVWELDVTVRRVESLHDAKTKEAMPSLFKRIGCITRLPLQWKDRLLIEVAEQSPDGRRSVLTEWPSRWSAKERY